MTFFAPELLAKRLQMLKEVAPSLARAGLLLIESQLPEVTRRISHEIEFVRATAKAMNVELFAIDAGGPEEFETLCDMRQTAHRGMVISEARNF